MGARRRRRPRGQALARALNGTVPIIAGAGLTTAIAYRWKTQINENAKSPSYSQELPEMDHNEIEGWSGARRVRPLLGGVPRRRRHPSARPGADGAHEPAHQAGRGGRASRALARPDAVERVFSLVLLGDLVSLYLAVLRGVDPEPVELLSALKAELARDA